MRRMLLAVFAVAAVGLSAGAASAEVVCSPVCGLVSSSDAQKVRQNEKDTKGKDNAAVKISPNGLANNNAGIGQSSNGGGGGGDGTLVLF